MYSLENMPAVVLASGFYHGGLLILCAQHSTVWKTEHQYKEQQNPVLYDVIRFVYRQIEIYQVRVQGFQTTHPNKML